MSLFALWSPAAQSYITRQGRVLVHGSREELEFLFPGSTVRPVHGIPADEQMPITAHPDLRYIRWPLRKDDFHA